MELDPIIDRSAEQKKLRLDKMTIELNGLGFSVVNSDWLRSIIAKNARQGAKYEVIA